MMLHALVHNTLPKLAILARVHCCFLICAVVIALDESKQEFSIVMTLQKTMWTKENRRHPDM